MKNDKEKKTVSGKISHWQFIGGYSYFTEQGSSIHFMDNFMGTGERAN